MLDVKMTDVTDHAGHEIAQDVKMQDMKLQGMKMQEWNNRTRKGTQAANFEAE